MRVGRFAMVVVTGLVLLAAWMECRNRGSLQVAVALSLSDVAEFASSSLPPPSDVAELAKESLHVEKMQPPSDAAKSAKQWQQDVRLSTMAQKLESWQPCQVPNGQRNITPCSVTATRYGFDIVSDHAQSIVEAGFVWDTHFELSQLWAHLLAPTGIDSSSGSLCASGELVIDCGMNEGFFTLLSLSRGCRVMTFELTPRMYTLLRTSVDRNKFGFQSVLPFNVAVADMATGRQVQFVSGKSSVAHISKSRREYDTFDRGTKGSIRTVRLDDLFDESTSTPRVAIMKVDVEGAELGVLNGSLSLLCSGRVRNVMVEIGRGRVWSSYGKSLKDGVWILKRLRACGFELRILRMWCQPNTKFIDPSSQMFVPRISHWPRHRIATPGLPDKGLAWVNAQLHTSATYGNELCQASKWKPRKPSAQSKEEQGEDAIWYTVVPDDQIEFFVTKVLNKRDFNMWFFHE